MAQLFPLSSNWNDSKTDDEIMLRNTYFNSKAIEFSNK